MRSVLELWTAPARSRSRAGRPRHGPKPEPEEVARAAEAYSRGLESYIAENAANDFPELWEALTDAGKETFAREVADAYVTAQGPEDRAPAMARVLEAWLRTLQMRQTPGYAEAVERAHAHVAEPPGESGETVYSLEEVRDLLGLPPG